MQTNMLEQSKKKDRKARRHLKVAGVSYAQSADQELSEPCSPTHLEVELVASRKCILTKRETPCTKSR